MHQNSYHNKVEVHSPPYNYQYILYFIHHIPDISNEHFSRALGICYNESCYGSITYNSEVVYATITHQTVVTALKALTLIASSILPDILG